MLRRGNENAMRRGKSSSRTKRREREREAGKSNGNLLKQKIVKHNWHCTEYLLCAVKRLISLITEQRNAHVGNNWKNWKLKISIPGDKRNTENRKIVIWPSVVSSEQSTKRSRYYATILETLTCNFPFIFSASFFELFIFQQIHRVFARFGAEKSIIYKSIKIYTNYSTFCDF